MTPDPWKSPPPVYGTHLPGGALPIALSLADGDDLVLPHGRVRQLHALLSAALLRGEVHHTTIPDFTLFQTPAALSGWAVYFRALDAARSLASLSHAGTLGHDVVTLTFGPLSRLRAPIVTATGRHRVEMVATTPVVIRHCKAGSLGRSERKEVYPRPSVQALTSALTTGFPERLGAEIDPASLAIQVLATQTRAQELHLGGLNGHGRVTGWTGRVILDVSPLGRWLLECAARIGLGGRTAYGFGQIQLRDVPMDAPLVGTPYGVCAEDWASPTALRDAEILLRVRGVEALPALRALLARARFESIAERGGWIYRADHLRLIVDKCALGRDRVASLRPYDERREKPPGAEGAFFITPHAVRQYIDRFEPRLSFEEARATLIHLTSEATKVRDFPDAPEMVQGAELWRGPRLGKIGGRVHVADRRRCEVGREAGKRLPFVATVLLNRPRPSPNG